LGFGYEGLPNAPQKNGETFFFFFFYHKWNDENPEELKVEPLEKKVRKYKSNWLRQATRMNNRMPKIMQNYKPNGRRLLGRPLKRLLSLKRLLFKTETSLSRRNSSRVVVMMMNVSGTERLRKLETACMYTVKY